MSAPVPLSGNALGAIWIIVSVAGATGMTLLVRVLTPDMHSAMLVFLRSALGVLVLLPLIWRVQATGRRLSFRAWQLHLLRGALITVALNGGFYAIWKLPMAQATILFFMAPVFATLLSMALVGERVGPRRWGAIAAGFVGAMIILRPTAGGLDPAMLAALVSSVCFAGSLIIGRLTATRDSADSTFVSSAAIVAFTTLPPALWVWSMPDSLMVWLLIGGLVLCSSLRGYADIQAYAVGDAGYLAPFSYLRLVTIGLAGYVWFGEVLDRPTLVGGAVIITATLYITLREQRLGRRRSGGAAAP